MFNTIFPFILHYLQLIELKLFQKIMKGTDSIVENDIKLALMWCHKAIQLISTSRLNANSQIGRKANSLYLSAIQIMEQNKLNF